MPDSGPFARGGIAVEPLQYPDISEIPYTPGGDYSVEANTHLACEPPQTGRTVPSVKVKILPAQVDYIQLALFVSSQV